MCDHANQPARTRRLNTILIGLFMIVLWLPSLDTLLHFDRTNSPDENRALAAPPQIPSGWHGWQRYTDGLADWFNDHFGCRNWLVRWHNKLQWSLFRQQNAHAALVGKDGWLFLTGSQMIEHYSGRLQFTPEELHDWQALLESRRDWLARRGVAYVFVVAPDKQTIYPEELPVWLTKVRPKTKLDQFYAYMRAHSTVPVLDLREALHRAKSVQPTYLQTDTHWNNFGAFVGYQELMRALAAPRPGLDPLPLTSFTMTRQFAPSTQHWWQTNQYWLAPFVLTNQFPPSHDLANLLGLKAVESNAIYLLPNPGLPSFTTKMAPPDRYDKDPCITENPQAPGRLMLFRDSFAESWVQFLGYHFNRVTYVWQNELDPAWIEREKPEIVVSEMVERNLNVDDPKKMLIKERLN